MAEEEPVTINMVPQVIRVEPLPNLRAKYFLERVVYADDPFTQDVVEPSIPYSLGLMMTNTGQGVTRDMKVTSSQPKIIENEKGLLVAFRIIGTRVRTQEVAPSLTANLGQIDPGGSVVAQWLMTSTLQG